VARDLLGATLVRAGPDGGRVAGEIVEVEAYQQDDPASHSFRGMTPRNSVMFGSEGHLYVYLSYGIHHCMNVVTAREGEGSAVLLRAARPVDGLEEMARRRPVSDPRLFCAGPGRLCQAFGVGPAQNGADLVGGDDIWIEGGRPVRDVEVAEGPRIGTTVAREKPWRLWLRGNPYVSRSRWAASPAPRPRARE
jgi:DNA-3-methyladenine glycosylase